jgi:uncharacterized membrane protein
MSWSRRFRIRQYLKGSIWLIPFLGGVLGAVLGALEPHLDHALTIRESWQYSPSTATAVLSAIIAAMAALTGFVVTVAVLVVQMAIGTFSARYMRLWYRDRMFKGVLAVLVGTLAYSFALLRSVESNFVPTIGVTIAGFLVVVGLLFFMVFLDRFLHRLRPVAVAALVGRAGRRAFEDGARKTEASGGEPGSQRLEPSYVVPSSRAGVIQALDEHGLVAWATTHGRVLYLPHSVGDYVPVGAALVEVLGTTPDPAADGRRVRGMFAFGDERTIEQDPAFALRIMVDIAIKALSAAINDPTTAVQVLDHMTEFLRLIGSTPIVGRTRVMRDGTGAVRLVGRGRSWEDYLALGVTEVREYGAGAIQVVRRLRAVLEELQESVLPEHREAVQTELDRLDAAAGLHFSDSVDFDRALAPDRQGIGGSTPALTLDHERLIRH